MSYSRIVVALDVMSDCAVTLVQRALQLAPGAEFTAMHIVEGYPYVGDSVAFRALADLHQAVEADVSTRLDTLCAPAGIERRIVREGHPASEIRRYAEAQGADLVILGAHGRRGWRRLLGSTANAVLHHRVCDVLCVHIPEEVRPFREVLVALDATEQSRTVLARAVEVAVASNARVSVVSVLRPAEYAYVGIDMSVYEETASGMARAADEQSQAHLDELAKSFGLTGERLVRHGYPADEIHMLAEEIRADLVVVGCHEHPGLGRLVGSTANAVLHGAKSDVLAVRL